MTTQKDPDVLYHTQPHTLDSTKEPPSEDAPLAQGHAAEDLETITEAHSELKDAVEEAAQNPDVGPRAPGDHAGSDGESDDDCPPSGTVEEVKAWVGSDPGRAEQALDAERAGQNRSSLISHLEGVISSNV